MFEFLDNSHISAIVLISEKNQSVSIHFSGFDSYEQAKNFSHFIMDELGIKNSEPFNSLQIPPNTTIH
jgi:hypothetical protein